MNEDFTCVTVLSMDSLYAEQSDCKHRMNFNPWKLGWIHILLSKGVRTTDEIKRKCQDIGRI